MWKYKLKLRLQEYVGPFVTSLVGIVVAIIAFSLSGFEFRILETINLLILSVSMIVGVYQWNKQDKKRYYEPKTKNVIPVDPESDDEILNRRVSEDSYRFFIQLAQIHFLYSIVLYFVQRVMI